MNLIWRGPALLTGALSLASRAGAAAFMLSGVPTIAKSFLRRAKGLPEPRRDDHKKPKGGSHR